MKTKDLIATLQEVDPSGEMEVCVGNHDIHFVAKEPAYYDGCLQVLTREPSKRPYWDIVGAEFRSDGNKIAIHELSIESMLMDIPDAPVTYDSDYSRRHYAAKVQEWRADAADEPEPESAQGTDG